MRPSPKVTILPGPDGIPFGVLLSADYCGQHECGIAGIERVLGISPGDRPRGMPSRTATRPTGGHLRIHRLDVERRAPTHGRRSRRKAVPETVPCTALVLHRYDADAAPSLIATDAERHLSREEVPAIVGHWDEDGVRIHAYTEASRSFLTELAEALASGDGAAWLAGGRDTPFGRAGLVVAIASRLPVEGSRRMLEADLADNALKDAALATGIQARLDDANEAAAPSGRGFRWPSPFGHHALSPRWLDEGERKGETAHPLVFFLNPMDQKGANHGWFTVEELDDWIAGRGPVPKGVPAPAPTPPEPFETAQPPDPRQGTLEL